MKQSLPALLAHQARYDGLIFLRNRQSQFFTLALPVIFLVIFASVFGGRSVDVAGGSLKVSIYYVPGIITLGIIAAAFVNLVVSVTTARESGIYKRRRATPVPASVVIAGRALTAVVAALTIAAVLLAIGWPAYGASIPGRTAPAFIMDIVVGALAFCCLGYAVASLIDTADAAQPLTQAVILPLYFISGVFVPASQIPGWLTRVPGPPSRPSAAHGLQPAYQRRGVRLARPGCCRTLGSRRPRGRASPLQLAAAGALKASEISWFLSGPRRVTKPSA